MRFSTIIIALTIAALPALADTVTLSNGDRVTGKIVNTAGAVRARIQRRSKPTLSFPLRTLSNVTYHPKKGFLELKGKKKVRTLTVATVKTFAQTLRMMALSKELIDTDDIATKREAYYVSKNWDAARFPGN